MKRRPSTLPPPGVTDGLALKERARQADSLQPQADDPGLESFKVKDDVRKLRHDWSRVDGVSDRIPDGNPHTRNALGKGRSISGET